MSKPTHPYRDYIQGHVSRSFGDLLDTGYELPFDADAVQIAFDSATLKMAAEICVEHDKPILAWLLYRYLNKHRRQGREMRMR